MLDAVKVLFILTGASTYLVYNLKLNPFHVCIEFWHKNITLSDGLQTTEDVIDEETLKEWTNGSLGVSLETTYDVQVLEEDRDLPKRLLQIKELTIGQKSTEGVMYLLAGDGVDDDMPERSRFAINAFTGELFLIAALDRDPPNGRTLFELNITAEDDKGQLLEGCARVNIRVKDINDNKPYFPRESYSGSVSENNEVGVEIMALSAVDSDSSDVIRYAIEMNRVDSSGQLIFEINELTGTISAAVCCLDREVIDRYTLKVCATDGEDKTCARVTIIVSDQNDETPKFTRKSIVVEISDRELNAGRVLTNISVVDNDLVTTNRFAYKILNLSHFAKYFSVIIGSEAQNTALIVLSRNMSLKSELFSQSNSCDISLTVVVTDSLDFTDESRVDYCSIEIRVSKSAVSFEETSNANEHRVDNGSEVIDRNGTKVKRQNATQRVGIIGGKGSAILLWSLCVAVVVLPLISLIICFHFCYIKRKKVKPNEVQTESESDLRDGVMTYDSEGGEVDHWSYDLTPLQIIVQTHVLLPDVCSKEIGIERQQ